jgi:hypothetical protein
MPAAAERFADVIAGQAGSLEREWAGLSGAVAEQPPATLTYVHVPAEAALVSLADDAPTVDQRDREIPRPARVVSQPAWELPADSLWPRRPARFAAEGRERLDGQAAWANAGLGRGRDWPGLPGSRVGG